MEPAAHLPDTTPRNRHFALAVAVILLAVAVGEIARIVVDNPWGVFPAWASHTVGAVLAAVWAATAVMLLLRHRARAFAKGAFVLGIMSPVLMFVHGVVTGGAFDRLGLCYVPLAAAVALLVKGAFGSGELLRLRRRHHLAHDAGLEASARYASSSQRGTP